MRVGPNEDVRRAARDAGVPLWKIAEKLGIQDSALSKKLRHGLPGWEKEKIMNIIRNPEARGEPMKLSRADALREMISTEDGLMDFLDGVCGATKHPWCGHDLKIKCTDEELEEGKADCDACMRAWLRKPTTEGVSTFDELGI